MASVDEELYTKLTTLVPDTPVEQDVIDASLGYTRVFFQRHGLDAEIFLTGEQGLITETWDIECISDSVSTCRDLADTIRNALNGFKGAMGSVGILGAFVTDQADNYIPKNVWAKDAGLFLRSLKLILYR